MGKNVTKISWKGIIYIIILIIYFNRIPAQTYSVNHELFPVPDNLKPNIEFWIKVYTLYNSDQVVIHDSDDLSIVYEVVDANELLGGDRFSQKSVWREVEKIKEGYQNILKRMAAYQPIAPELLDQKELFVYNLFKSKASPEVFRQAAQAIRGQQGLRDRFRKGLIRSGRYTEHIEKVLKEYDIPQELGTLPHVESSFDYRAYSKFGAAGIWQFTRGTGRRFLQINYTVDERFDPVKSTEAAAKLLRENHDELGTWPLAITAYNHGVNGLKRAVAQLGTTDIGVIVEKYSSNYFKFASRNFYAEFIAAEEVRKNYKIYFGELQFDPPETCLTFNVPNPVKITNLAERLGLTIADIRQLNPSLRESVLSAKRHLPKGFELRIPWKSDFDPKLVSAHLPMPETAPTQVTSDWYQVESGDNLQQIAKRYHLTVAEIMDLNDLKNPHQIYVGQVLRLKPEATVLADASRSKTPATGSAIPAELEPVDDKKVKAGSAPAIGDQISGPPTATEKIESENERKKLTMAEKKVTNEPEPESIAIEPVSPLVEKSFTQPLKPAYGTIYVQTEETLGHYADWLGISTQELRDLNGLKFGQDIHLGQKIKLLFKNVTGKEFTRRRAEYHRGIEEDFFATFKIDGVIVHKIKSGENIWYLCNQVYELPYWLILKYNPNKNLEQLQHGDELVIPIAEKIENNISG